MGYLYGFMSVLLVSAAQLVMKWAMMQLPAVRLTPDFVLDVVTQYTGAVLALIAGLMAYVLSMGCWYLALRRIPLSKAYPLLSLSYILVWGAALLLPWLHEPFSPQKLAGVAVIFIGLLLIFLPPIKADR